DFCMISAHVVFTNDRFPRAGNRALTGLETSDPTDETVATRVGRGTTIGANATVGPGVSLGEFSMIGMGSVVTRNVIPHALVVGNPARQIGWVCVCGHPIEKWREKPAAPSGVVEGAAPLTCRECGRSFLVSGGAMRLRDS